MRAIGPMSAWRRKFAELLQPDTLRNTSCGYVYYSVNSTALADKRLMANRAIRRGRTNSRCMRWGVASSPELESPNRTAEYRGAHAYALLIRAHLSSQSGQHGAIHAQRLTFWILEVKLDHRRCHKRYSAAYTCQSCNMVRRYKIWEVP